HGKTTTSSMIGTMLAHARRDPTMIIGGIVKSLATNIRHGRGDIIVVEADEFDRGFLSLAPTIAVVTNIDLEHLDCYQNLDELTQAFTQFANAVPFYGKVIACLDDANVQALLPQIKRTVTTFGMAAQADIQARKPVYHEEQTEFELILPESDPVRASLQVPGKHNILNALASIATGLELEVPVAEILEGLAEYNGVNRRFEITESVNDVLFVDDYAHHPREVAAVLKAARKGWERRIVAVFQPHLYTRTRDFHEDFARAFLASDVLIVTDIYPARESPLKGITGELIAVDAINFGHKNVHFVPDKNDLGESTAALIKPGDMVLTLGAGDINQYNSIIRDSYR
ncbi:MAG: UDP-N-acetylmuramate--L-alanine ligase, partial [Candidatus Marinimicrobia bacterium]|nr:UDP-N-acetylmuramate--L-alanine ligase [Candidatus Neomarinimicrobiota bacterium]